MSLLVRDVLCVSFFLLFTGRYSSGAALDGASDKKKRVYLLSRPGSKALSGDGLKSENRHGLEKELGLRRITGCVSHGCFEAPSSLALIIPIFHLYTSRCIAYLVLKLELELTSSLWIIRMYVSRNDTPHTDP